MLLKRLELQGFKSFAEKTALDLGHKVTAIVGPNGSGKSNITDSIRWLLGERDARNLRGGKGEDLIFAGTKERPRAGMAQATLYFDNSSGALPLEYKDVAIARKVTREGPSTFLINKAEVRLKDVIEFFAKAKLGARGLSIINQGESDLFIKATPQERREMIEEILGLREYQIKKAEAVNRLKNTEFNLEKVRALLEELKPHLRLLRRQVSRYEGRAEAMAELAELENHFYGYQINTLEKDLREVEADEKSLAVSIKTEVGGLDQLRQELAKVKVGEPKSMKELTAIRQQENALLQEKANLQLELGKVEARLEMAKESRGFDPGKAERALMEIRKLSSAVAASVDVAELQEAVRKILALVENLGGDEKHPEASRSFTKDRETILVRLADIGTKLTKLKETEERLRGGLEGFNRELSARYESLEAKQNKLTSLEHEQSDVLIKKERLEVRLESLSDELRQIGRKRESLGPGQKPVGMSDDEVKQKMMRLRSTLAAVGEIDEGIVKEARETEERYGFLEGQLIDLEKAIGDLENLIADLDAKIRGDFDAAIAKINSEFAKLVKIVFGGGQGKIKLERFSKNKIQGTEGEEEAVVGEQVVPGVLIDITLPKKRIKGLEVLSGGERALVSIAALFALISVSPPPFLFLDEIDAALDERNARRFGEILKEFSGQTQFVIVTHSRATMEAADVLYGVTMGKDGTSRLVSLRLAERSA